MKFAQNKTNPEPGLTAGKLASDPCGPSPLCPLPLMALLFSES